MMKLRHISIRVPESVYEALKGMGEAQQRSVSAEVRQALMHHTSMTRYQAKPPKATIYNEENDT